MFLIYHTFFCAINIGGKTRFADMFVECTDIGWFATDICSKCTEIVQITADIHTECADIINLAPIKEI